MTDSIYSEKGKILCLDWGKKKSGLAISDITQNFTKPISVVPTKQLVINLQKIYESDKFTVLLIGLPVSKLGKSEENIKAKTQFLIKVAEQLNCQLIYHNERLSSWQAQQLMKNTKYSPDFEDAIAAQVILNSYLGIVDYMSE